MGYSRLRNDFSTRADRADVHGRPGAADRLRQRREPADRARRSCGRRRSPCGCRSARRAAGWCGSCWSRACVLSFAGGVVGPRARGRADARRCSRWCRRRAAAADQRRSPISRILAFTLGLTFAHRHRLRPAAGAARQPARSVDDAEGHGRIDRRHRRVAVPAQGPGHRAGRAQLPAAVRRRPVRAQPAEPEDHRHRRRARQPRDVPARRRRSAATTSQRAVQFYQRAARAAALGAGREVGGAWPRCRS